MPFGGEKPKKGSPHLQDPRSVPNAQGQKDQQYLDLFLEASGKKPEIRVEQRKDEMIWERLQRADVALAVEKYFRYNSDPTEEGLLAFVDFPPDLVGDEFVKHCKRINETLHKTKKDVQRVIRFLGRDVEARGFKATEGSRARALFFDMMGRYPKCPLSKISVRVVHGFLFMAIDDDAEYDALYKETKEGQKSGGRFHRAQMVKIAGTEVPLIVRRGGHVLDVDPDEDGIMIHEIQHWINEGLVGFSQAERESKGLQKLNKGQQRIEFLNAVKARRAIKDEVLAYLRQGCFQWAEDDQAVGIEKIFTSDLYSHLFKNSPDEVEKNKEILHEISEEMMQLSSFAKRYLGFADRMTYALIDVPFEHLARKMRAMREFYERNLSFAHKQEVKYGVNISAVRAVPRNFEHEWQVLNYLITEAQAEGRKYTNQILNSRIMPHAENLKTMQGAVIQAWEEVEKCKERMLLRGAFVPYVSGMSYQDSQLHAHGEAVSHMDKRSVLLILDECVKQEVLDVIHGVDFGRPTKSEIAKRDEIAARFVPVFSSLGASLVHRGYTYPIMRAFASSEGVQIQFITKRKNEDHEVFSFAIMFPAPFKQNAHDVRSLTDYERIASAHYIFDTTYLSGFTQEAYCGVLPPEYADVYNKIRNLERVISERTGEVDDLLDMDDWTPASIEKFDMKFKILQFAKSRHAHLQKQLYKNNVHIPVMQNIVFDEGGRDTTVAHQAENVMREFFRCADNVAQSNVDAWYTAARQGESRRAIDGLTRCMQAWFAKKNVLEYELQPEVIDIIAYNDRLNVKVSCTFRKGGDTFKAMASMGFFSSNNIASNVSIE